MANFCRICGNKMSETAQHCPKCGTHMDAGVGSVPAKKRRSGFVPFVALVLAVAIVLYGWPGLLLEKHPDSGSGAVSKNNDYQNNTQNNAGSGGAELAGGDSDAAPITVELKAGSRTVYAGDITVDFGDFNITDDTVLEIRDLGSKKDSVSGEDVRMYDFKLDGDGEFLGVVSITVPCEDAENSRVKYLNEDSGVWEPVYSTVDRANGTITFYTTHFSRFGIFEGFEYSEGYNSGPMAQVRFNADVLDRLLEQCEANMDEFMTMMRNSKIENKVIIDALGKGVEKSGNVASVAGMGADFIKTVFEYIDHYPGAEAANKLGSQLAYIGAGLTALKVAHTWYDTGSFTEAFVKNRAEILEATVSVTAAALGSTTLGVVGAVIWASNTVEKEIESALNAGYENPLQHAYYKFQFEYGAYSPSARRFCTYLPNRMYSRAILESEQPEMAMVDAVLMSDGKVWWKIFKAEFLKNRSEPQKVFDEIGRRMDSFLNVFWQLTPNVRKVVAEEIHKAHPWTEPSRKEIEWLKFGAKAKLNRKLRNYYAAIYDRMLIDAKQRLLWEIEDLEKTLNTVTNIRVVEMDENGVEKPLSDGKYKDYVASVVASPDSRAGTWTWNPGSEKRPNFECTLYNYLSNDKPICVNFYKSWDDLIQNKVAFSQEFSYELGEVKIVISDKALSVKDVVGTYDMSLSDGEQLLFEHTFTFSEAGDGFYMYFLGDRFDFSFDSKTGKAYAKVEGQEDYAMVLDLVFKKSGDDIVFEGVQQIYSKDGDSVRTLAGKKKK